jgi:thioredoxin reductase (NADPH)
MSDDTYHIIILGAGPAGLQAAIHSARKKARVLLLGRIDKSSLWWAHEVENFCCIFSLNGEDMLKTGLEQADRFGAEIVEEDVIEASVENDLFHVISESGHLYKGRTLIIATGSTRKRLRVPGEKELLGRGVSYCVDCDAGFFRGERVVVVGNESAAVSGALHLQGIASEVYLITDGLNVADELAEALKNSSVQVREGAVKTITGEVAVEGVELEDGTFIEGAGVFIELGAKGVLELTSPLGVALDDEMKYIPTDKKMRTNVEGIFAAGDVTGPPLQMAKAVGEGCVAGIEASIVSKKKI